MSSKKKQTKKQRQPSKRKGGEKTEKQKAKVRELMQSYLNSIAGEQEFESLLSKQRTMSEGFAEKIREAWGSGAFVYEGVRYLPSTLRGRPTLSVTRRTEEEL